MSGNVQELTTLGMGQAFNYVCLTMMDCRCSEAIQILYNLVGEMVKAPGLVWVVLGFKSIDRTLTNCFQKRPPQPHINSTTGPDVSEDTSRNNARQHRTARRKTAQHDTTLTGGKNLFEILLFLYQSPTIFNESA
ncbi:hypothetical protein HELRODRAFT_166116 [Helobdella robusta]|uniref:Uncharacterized protein n=1 Tax=Helobdella robusta TaxID=6412 RepID=T1EXS8_HELRO|nr:hypothetical protein HELRODRAFT_166116 [Helobdella robusta]ESN90450.1 hypothetical protein HELRODRAFT_166116 [Helobdella robusta]